MRTRLVPLIGTTAAALLLVTGCIRFGSSTTYDVTTDGTDVTRAVALADVTGDGLDDAIVLTDRALVRLEPCGSGCLVRREVIALPDRHEMFVGDFDGDGIDDVAVDAHYRTPEEGDPSRVYFGGPAAGSRPAGLSAMDSMDVSLIDNYGYESTVIATGDFDGDGVQDLLMHGVEYQTLLGRPSRQFAPGTSLPISPSPRVTVRSVQVGDIDGNGDDEIITQAACVCGSSILWGIGVDLGPPITLLDPPLTVRAVGDLDGDGRDDLVGAASTLIGDSYPPSLRFLRSTGSELVPFATGQPLATEGTARSTTVADLDNDGRNDLVALEAGVQKLAWWNGAGNGGFFAPYGIERLDLALGFTPNGLAIGDLDGDGLEDLLIGHAGTDAKVTLLMNDSLVAS